MSQPTNNPDLMVVGDSVAQGCRSLTVTAEFCAQSYPATLARLANLTSFTTPSHPWAVMGDLEKLASDMLIQGVKAMTGGVNRNYSGWLSTFRAATGRQPVTFDNLAVAGSTIEDAVGMNSNPGSDPPVGTPDLADKFLSTFPKFDIFNPTDRDALTNLHLAVNSRFVLNPSNDAAYRGYSMLDWVTLRQPKNLIVHLGHNNGLYKIGSKGDTLEWNQQWMNGARPALARYISLLAALDNALPDTRVMVLGLPKVGAVANLMPDIEEGPHRTHSGYWETYWTTFPTPRRVEGTLIKTADDQIRSINSLLKAETDATSKRRKQWDFYDVYDFFHRYDAKNLGARAKSLRIGGFDITNNYLHGERTRLPGKPGTNPKFRWDFESGGLQSIDGMHPTLIGYTLLATELVEWLTGKPLSQAACDRELSWALKNERLIQFYPPALSTIVRKVRKAGEGLPEDPQDYALAAIAGQVR